jgi:hypothetical protein
MNRYSNLDSSINIVNDAQPIGVLKEHWSCYELIVNDDESIRFFKNLKTNSKDLIVYKKDLRIDCHGLNIDNGSYIKNKPEKYLANYMDWAMRLCQHRFCDLIYINDEINFLLLNDYINENNYDKIYFIWPADNDIEARNRYNEICQHYSNADITMYSIEPLLNLEFGGLRPLITQIEDSLGYQINDEKNEFVKYSMAPWRGKIYTTMSHWLWAYNFLIHKKWI